ncbi:MAG: helix-turn-helix domain-containing protein [Syntrophobacteraceae bacterium]|jgi:transcriptional regulator with XRE-family HTH domain
MKKGTRKNSAVEILHQRYIGDNETRKASVQAERINAEVAQKIYEIRKEAGLSQKALADLVETTQSVISRLEDADYEGHSLSMLSRIAKVLDRDIMIAMPSKETPDKGFSNADRNMIRFAFREVVRGLRLKKGLTVDQFAKKVQIDKEEILAMERDSNYLPPPLTLFKLSGFYKISQRKLAVLAGAIKDMPRAFREEASRFAAQSESFSRLTDEEKQILDKFVAFLREESK